MAEAVTTAAAGVVEMVEVEVAVAVAVVMVARSEPLQYTI